MFCRFMLKKDQVANTSCYGTQPRLRHDGTSILCRGTSRKVLVQTAYGALNMHLLISDVGKGASAPQGL